jgi:hypothetical protein
MVMTADAVQWLLETKTTTLLQFNEGWKTSLTFEEGRSVAWPLDL